MNIEERKAKYDNMPDDPCQDCDDLSGDDFGLICNWTCGLATAYSNFMRGYRMGQDERR